MSENELIEPETIRQRLRRLQQIVNHVQHLAPEDVNWLRSWLDDPSNLHRAQTGADK